MAKRQPAKRGAQQKAVNKQLVLKALVDPKFRKQLEQKPEAALGMKGLTEAQKAHVQLVLAAVKGIQRQISALADQLLCANGGPCGIA